MRDMRLRMIWAQENSAVSEFRATRYMGELMATATQRVRRPRPRPRPLADRRGCSAPCRCCLQALPRGRRPARAEWWPCAASRRLLCWLRCWLT
jgi:hypothetical protein